MGEIVLNQLGFVFDVVFVSGLVAGDTYVEELFDGFAVLVEFLINITFHVSDTLVWSLYPLSCSLIFGVTLIVIACCPKMREGLRRKFFI